MAGDAPPATESKRPVDSAFQQQRLKAWQPLLTPKYVIGTFFLVGCIFVPVGIVVLHASNTVVEISQRYDDMSPPTSVNGTMRQVTLNITKDMDAPIYFYYQLTNFYQNHRRYVKSRSDEQLRGKEGASLSSCEPLESYGTPSKKMYPCGLIANSMFTDTFNASVIRNGQVAMNDLRGDDWTDKNIAWKSDREEKFVALTPAQIADSGYSTVGPNGPLPRVDDEHFMVWMRTAALPTFKKLHHKILGTSLKAGDRLVIHIKDSYDVKQFGGEKHIVLSTTSWLGGKNDFLGFAYIIVGTLCLLLASAFFIKHKVSPRKLGDMQYFNWPGRKTGASPAN